MKKFLRITFIMSVFILSAGISAATPITVSITAEIFDVNGSLSDIIDIGDIITGSYTYDSIATDSDPRSDVGIYNYDTMPYGITLNINDYVFQTDPDDVDFGVSVLYDYVMGGYSIMSSNNITTAPVGDYSIKWSLIGQGVSTSTDIPLVPPNLSFGDYNVLTIEGDSMPPLLGARVTSVEVVPEPATILLLISGLLCFAGFRRKFKR